jgi:hypothetical protein
LLQEALGRCDRNETGGIIVARLDRFARSAVDALESIKRLNAAGARLVSVEDNFDGSPPMGRFAIGILTLIAELELERIKENWTSAVTTAVGRGVHISARVPTGYRKDKKSGRLLRDEPAASVVAEAFRQRATGVSWRGWPPCWRRRRCTRQPGTSIGRRSGSPGCCKTPSTWGRREAARSSTRARMKRLSPGPSSTPRKRQPRS